MAKEITFLILLVYASLQHPFWRMRFGIAAQI
jgi:hypothetical protein